MSDNLLKLVCSDEVIARVLASPDGRVFVSEHPLLPGKIFVGPDGILTRGLARKDGGRLKEAGAPIRVLLDSPEADRWSFGQEHWGTLPAWCRRCGETHWYDVDVLRTARGTLRR